MGRPQRCFFGSDVLAFVVDAVISVVNGSSVGQ